MDYVMYRKIYGKDTTIFNSWYFGVVNSVISHVF